MEDGEHTPFFCDSLGQACDTLMFEKILSSFRKIKVMKLTAFAVASI